MHRPPGRRLHLPSEQGRVAQVPSLLCFRVLLCTGVARKFVGKGVVGVRGSMASSRSCGLKDARAEHGAGVCHSLVPAQGGDTAAAAVGASLCWLPGSSSVQRSLCQEGLPCSAQGSSPDRAEDAWKFSQKAIEE